MRIVSPYRPFVPESVEHLRLGAFDWTGALTMSRASVEAVYGSSSWLAMTDVDTTLPVPALQYQTTHRRLMLWIVEVCLRYLESDDFDQDTVMLSPDVLLLDTIDSWFTADLGVMARLQPKHLEKGRPLLNSCQWWGYEAKERLIGFYRRALAIAEYLPENRIQWGADTDPLVQLLSPVTGEGVRLRDGLWVNFIDERQVMDALTETDIAALEQGTCLRRSPLPMMDFRYTRKHFMAAYYEATVGKSRVEA